MIVAAMLIDALHATLEDREKALDGVGVKGGVLARNILPDTLAYKPMIAEVHTQAGVLPRLIGQDTRFTVYVGLKDGQEGLHLKIVHNDATACPVLRSTRDKTLCLWL